MTAGHVADNNLAEQLDSKQIKRSRRMGVLIFSAFLLPMLAAYLIFHTGIGLPLGTINKGSLLLPPQAIADLPVYRASGEPLDLLADKKDKKWRLLIPGQADCSQSCLDTLYLTRQVHIRLGEKSKRVERVYLNVAGDLDGDFEAMLVEEHPRLQRARVQVEDLQQWLADSNMAVDKQGSPVSEGRYFLMDQEGFVMMAYDASHEGNQLLSDIKRLLKYSYED